MDEDLKELFPSIHYDSSKFIPNPDFNKGLFSDASFLPKEFLQKYTVLKTTPFTLEVLKKSSNKGKGDRIL